MTRTTRTPGKDVAYFLAQRYSGNLKLAGMIYLYRSLDIRVTRNLEEPLYIPGTLCQKGKCVHVVLETSVWERLGSGRGDGIAREVKLRSTSWANILQCGGWMLRHDISEESALRIVNHILSLFGNMGIGI